ncbi:MAG: ABC transporter ATP-binding protein [Proteobacteria bacterium]|jgi:branched-chain amino acid transport system ATP-binding protein|nr:ABC transporter ATP-binding protein [Pseudomonadota bacterium]
MTILKTHGIKKHFAKFAALKGISMEVKQGEIRAIIGPNGAGKTTFFNVITGKLKPTEGAVYFEEKDITGKPPHKITSYGIGRTFQIINIFPGLTTIENIMLSVLNKHGENMAFFARPQNRDSMKEECFKVMRQIGLEENADTLATNLSHGDKKKLDIGIGLARGPKILLLDEPTAGLNPQENQSIVHLIKEVAARENLTIVLIEHDMDAVFSISDYISVFQQGTVIAEGKPDEVKNNKLVIDAYLGEDF